MLRVLGIGFRVSLGFEVFGFRFLGPGAALCQAMLCLYHNTSTRTVPESPQILIT